MAYFDSVLYPDRSFLGEAGFCAPNRPSPFSGSIIRTGGVKFLRQLCALGANVTLLKNAIRTRATDERSPKLRGRIHQCLRANSLTPAASSMLRERLGVYTSVPRGGGSWKDGPGDPTPVQLEGTLLNYRPGKQPLLAVQRHWAVTAESDTDYAHTVDGRIRILKDMGASPRERFCRTMCRFQVIYRGGSGKWHLQLMARMGPRFFFSNSRRISLPPDWRITGPNVTVGRL